MVIDFLQLNDQAGIMCLYTHLCVVTLLHRFPCQRSQSAKLRCVLHYFERLSELNQDQGPSGKLFFTRQVCISDHQVALRSKIMQNVYYRLYTFFYLGKFLMKLADDQCSSATEASMYHIKRYAHTAFYHGSGLT